MVRGPVLKPIAKIVVLYFACAGESFLSLKPLIAFGVYRRDGVPDLWPANFGRGTARAIL